MTHTGKSSSPICLGSSIWLASTPSQLPTLQPPSCCRPSSPSLSMIG
uniref:Uncharacterized protein n=1 Tax=Arundo donax TaxID=35708 RepID=A0A0A9FNR4_ARUDO